MGEFKDTMMTALEEFNSQTVEPTVKAKKAKKPSEVTFTFEGSGIDMVVTRNLSGKPQRILYIFLSQRDEEDRGRILIKDIKKGLMTEATDSLIFGFFKGLDYEISTGLDVMPHVKYTKRFAEKLMLAREREFTDLLKVGALTISTIDGVDGYRTPSYARFNRYVYSTVGFEIASPQRLKLVRDLFTHLSELKGKSYGEMFDEVCGDHYRSADDKSDDIWAFVMLGDIYDDDFARRCYYEYMDNGNLSGLDCYRLRRVIEACVNDEYLHDYSWADVLKNFKDNPRIRLEKNRFWEFIQHAVCVGMGSELGAYLDQYRDYLRIAYKCDGKIKDKYPEYVQVAHDIYAEKDRKMSRFHQDAELLEAAKKGAPIIDQTIDGYELKVLGTPNEFMEEARQNSNCVASYMERAANGYCWIASFRPARSTHTQLTIELNPDYEMVQIKGMYNRSPKEKEMEILEKFQEGIRKRLEQTKETIA